MTTAHLKQEALKERQRMIEKYGDKSAVIGSEKMNRFVVPTPSLDLDYRLGTGGFRRGVATEIFGPPKLGKSSCLGLGTLANAQKLNLLTGIIAMEPDFDNEWAELHGCDPDLTIIARPDAGEEAFGMLRDWVYSGVVDFILFDSLGALSSDKAVESDKAQAYGESALITWGVKRVMPRAYKNQVGMIFINQQRDDTKTRTSPGINLVESPGGWGFKHMCRTRLHLKPGKDRHMAEVDGEKILVGREIIANIKANQSAQSMGKNARFDYYHIETADNGIGIDYVKDIINVGKVTKVIEPAGAWLRHPSFPDGQLNGKAAVAEFLDKNPKVVEVIRKDVMTYMKERQAREAAERAAKLKDSATKKEKDKSGDEGK